MAIKVPREVYKGLQAVRESGAVDMRSRTSVVIKAHYLGYPKTHDWVAADENFYAYARGGVRRLRGRRGGVMRLVADYIHYYRGYWSEGGKCRIGIYQEDGHDPVVIRSQLPDNENTSVTNMAEYLAAEVIEEHSLPTPLLWVEHYPEHEGEPGEYSLVRFSSYQRNEMCLGGVWRYRVGSPERSPLCPEDIETLIERTEEQQMAPLRRKKLF